MSFHIKISFEKKDFIASKHLKANEKDMIHLLSPLPTSPKFCVYKTGLSGKSQRKGRPKTLKDSDRWKWWKMR